MKLLLLLVATASCVVAQRGSISSGVCYPTQSLRVATAADNTSRASLSSANRSGLLLPVSIRCEHGPVGIIHTVPYEFHWPPIYKGSCDKLKCKDPPCIARRKVWRTRCVLVYRLVHGYWRRVGFRKRRFLDHLKCGCKQCRDIKHESTCVRTKPCPNTYSKKTYCYWRKIGFHGRCNCCTPPPKGCPYPKIHHKSTCSCVCPKKKCPKGQIRNRRTCQCHCPRGTRKVGQKCIGVCKFVGLRYCKTTVCRDNPLFKCEIQYNKCICPSCDRASVSQCRRTKCVEQKYKPHCTYDTYKKKCRCPVCEEQKTKAKCLKTHCGYLYHQQCRFDTNHNKCFCPA